MTPDEVQARTADALKGIETLSSEAPAQAAAPAKDESAAPVGSAPGADELAAAAEGHELDALTLATLKAQFLTAKLEAVVADFSPGVRADLARLLRPHVAVTKDGVTLGGKPLNRETVLEHLGSIAAALQPAKGIPGSGQRGPKGEARGSDPNAWLDSQEEFEKNKKAIKARGHK